MELAGIDVPIEPVSTTRARGGADRPLNGVLARPRGRRRRAHAAAPLAGGPRRLHGARRPHGGDPDGGGRRARLLMPDSVRERLAGITRGQWAFAVGCLLLMVALPVGVTLARDDRFESRIELVTVAGLPELQRLTISTDLNAYVSRVASRRRVTEATSRRLSFPLDSASVAERTRVVLGEAPEVSSSSRPEPPRSGPGSWPRSSPAVWWPSRRAIPRRGPGSASERLLAQGERPGLSNADAPRSPPGSTMQQRSSRTHGRPCMSYVRPPPP